ncbi:hypothetical protein FAJ35_02205 [Streptococcus suis]|uniref:Uncharacterized protein n=1 Tax=Streptococcus suis TaxID=1307 RepID=A0A4T2GX56_STRSU|nr:hypothetical protein FAJ35_02205 [Streptococcus suis]
MGKNSTSLKRVRLPTPAQLIRSDLECKTRTNLPINHCAEMLTRTLRRGAGLSAQPQLFLYRCKTCSSSTCNTPASKWLGAMYLATALTLSVAFSMA